MRSSATTGWATRPASARRRHRGPINLDWGDGSRVAARFTAQGPAKSQVALQQEPLPDAAAVEELRAFWRARLADLKARLEAERRRRV